MLRMQTRIRHDDKPRVNKHGQGRIGALWVLQQSTWALGRGARETCGPTGHMGIPGYINTAPGHWERGRGDLRSAQQSTDSHVACTASDVLSEWGTWVMHGREAEMGLAQRARGTRAQGHML